MTISKTAKTATATITVSDSGENSIVVVLGANSEFSPSNVEQIESCLISKAKVICCQLEIPTKTTLTALKMAKKHHVTTIFNAAPGLPNIDSFLLNFVDILCTNENETEMLTNISVNSVNDAKKAVKFLLAEGPKTVIVTLGENGAVVGSNEMDHVYHATVPRIKAVDTTGAGDCFVGSLAYFLVAYPELSIWEQVEKSAQIATISVQKNGTQVSYPTLNELNPSILC